MLHDSLLFQEHYGKTEKNVPVTLPDSPWPCLTVPDAD